MPIKHLVLSGGGPAGLIMAGTLSELMKKEYFNIQDIKSIHGTSIGAGIGAMLCLKYDWDDIYMYFIKRPWEKTLEIKSDDISNMFNGGGYLDKVFNVIKNEIYLNLFKMYDITEDTTLKEFYDITNIDLYIYTCNVANYETLELNHKSHPDLSLIKALCMSSCLPPVFRPIEYNGTYYMDGGSLHNYPLNHCINYNKGNEDEILGINMARPITEQFNPNDCNVFNYTMHLYTALRDKISNTYNQDKIKNEIILRRDDSTMSGNMWTNFFTKEEYRNNLWEIGIDEAKKYVANLKN